MKTFLLGLLLAGASLTATAQSKIKIAQETSNCAQKCEVVRVINGGTFLGVNIQSKKTKSQVTVRQVVEGTSADKMGIQVGDIIVSINGVEMETYFHTREFVQAQKVGQPVKVVVLRDGKKKVLRGELGFDQTKTIKKMVCCDELGNTLTLKKVNVYPNPSRGAFQLSFQGNNQSDYNVKLVDLNGNVVFEQHVKAFGKQVQEQINANVFSAGDYRLVIEQNEKTFTTPMVIVQ